MSSVRSDGWVYAAGRPRTRGSSFEVKLNTGDCPTSSGNCGREREAEIPTLGSLCLRSLESSLGKGLATFDFQDLPLGLCQLIYQFVSSKGSRMANMEVLKALAPVLRHHVISLDFSRVKVLGDSALLELAGGCDSSLMELDLSACYFVTDSGLLATLVRCPYLTDLTLSGCRQISDQTAFHLSHRCTGLTTLNLAGLQELTNDGVACIAFLPALEELCLARCNVSDSAIISLAAGPSSQTLRRLDLSGTATKGQGLASLRSLRKLEYLALSSTSSCLSVMTVAALARDLRLPVCLPEAPKTRGKCNRSLLAGSEWSERQLSCLRSKRPAEAEPPAQSWQNSASTICCARNSGPTKAMRLLGSAGRTFSSFAFSSSSDDVVKVKFQDGTIEEGGRQLLQSLIQGIVKLWPAVPSR